jgi:hypothetical protein
MSLARELIASPKRSASTVVTCLAAASGAALFGLGTPLLAGEKNAETAKNIIAAQIRSQGYACSNALSAERDVERSKAHEAVWLLKCENATYRVRLVPDMAAHVERMD